MRIIVSPLLLLSLASRSAHTAASSSLDGEDITLHAGIMALPPYAVQSNETGEWGGFILDVSNLLMKNAKMNHGVSLDIITDASDPYYLLNGENGREGLESYNDALALLSPECTKDCLDMILADYYETPERRELVEFTPPYQLSYNTYFKKKDNALNTAEEVNDNGGTGCLIKGTATYTAVSPSFNQVVDCDDAYDCYEKLMNGECDLFGGDVLIGKYQIKEAYPDDLTYTGEVINEQAYKLALPMKKSLPPSTLQLMKDLMNEATASGELGDIEKKYFGSASDISIYFGEEESEVSPLGQTTEVEQTNTEGVATAAADDSSGTVARNPVAALVVVVSLLLVVHV